MRKDIVVIADRLIPKPTGIQRKQERFVTDDIINEVLLKFQQCNEQLKQFAPYLKGSTVRDTCNNVWKFWRSNITYIADDAKNGKQIIKSPASVWEDKFCDCKSFAVAVMSCLHHLGIKSVFRFVAFPGGIKTMPTHVYNVAKYQGGEIVIDCCLPQFDMQKPYAQKYDYLPAGLYSVTGVGKSGFFKAFGRMAPLANAVDLVRRMKSKKRRRGELRLENVKNEAELGLVIHEQRLELEQDLAAKVHGIGSTIDNCYQVELAAINNAICECGNPELAAERCYVNLKPATSYIGKPLNRQVIEIGKKEKTAKKANTKKVEKKAKKEQKKVTKAIKKNEAGKGINKKDAKRLEKLNITVKKKKEGILKKVAKVITAPVRLVQKGIIQATLPKSAPAFLYLFITDQRVLDKAPQIVLSKRNKAMQYADRVVNKIGMKREHLMGILRNGIMQNMGDTPENVLAKWMADAGFRIGIISELLEAGKALGSLLGGKAAELMNDAPDPSDWGTLSADVKETMATTVQQQDTNNDSTTGNGSVPVKTEEQIYQQAVNPGFDYGTTPNYGTNVPTTLVKPAYNTADYGSGNFGQQNYEGKTMDNVTVTAKKPAQETDENTDDNTAQEPEQSGNNTGLFIALAAVALLAASGGKRKKKAA